MKKIIAAAMLVASFALVSASAKTKVTEEVRVRIINHQNSATGGALPDWVKATREGSTRKIAKALDIDYKDNHLFVVIGEGPNKEFLKTWTRQVNGASQISQEFERVVAEVTQAEFEGKSDTEKASANEAAKIYSASMHNLVLNGLAKEAEYWVQQQILAPRYTSWKKMQKDLDKAQKKAKGAEVNTKDYYTEEFVYYIVYSMDNDTYNRQLEAAMSDVADNSTESVLLKQSLTTKLQDALIPSRAIVDTPSDDE
ncbi:MAG: hypothetical protein II811_02355 [Spirochaetaceae bacterium]|nr:hypothetical protein [Spirochaetaceae bacterium]